MTPVTTAAGDTTSPTVRFGLVTTSNGYELSEVDAFATRSEKPVTLVQYSRDFAWGIFEPDIAQQVTARYGNVMVMMEPKDYRATSPIQPTYALHNLINGNFDTYLHTWASRVKASHVHILLRFAHEMNGDWYPWSEAVNGNRPGEYVQAWRHVHDLFAADGVTNVEWVWSPNTEQPGTLPMSRFYPGDAYVDWVALDGYNWGSGVGTGNWRSPSQVFDASVAELHSIAPTKPVMLAEVGCSPLGGNKAQWIADFFHWLPSHPEIRMFVWENMHQEADWRIESSADAQAAFNAGIANSRYH